MTVTIYTDDDRPILVDLFFDEPDLSVGYGGGFVVEGATLGDEDVELTPAQEAEAFDAGVELGLELAEAAEEQRIEAWEQSR